MHNQVFRKGYVPMRRSYIHAFAAVVFMTAPVAAAHAQAKAESQTANTPLAVAQFAGPDSNLGSYISQTLVSDLAHFGQFTLAQPADTVAALGAIHANPADGLTGYQVRQVCKILNANELVTGSYFQINGEVDISVQVLDGTTGKLLPGGGATISGSMSNLLEVTRSLASKIVTTIVTAPPPALVVHHESRAPINIPIAAHFVLPTAVAPVMPKIPTTPISDTGPFSGLVVVAFGLSAHRAMGARVLDEDGNVLYPTPNHMPSYDFVDDQGTMTYEHHLSESPRAGDHPLVVNAQRVAGFDYIVDNATAARIRAANAQDHFLWDWHVTALVDKDK
jgi:TolB-like protein